MLKFKSWFTENQSPGVLIKVCKKSRDVCCEQIIILTLMNLLIQWKKKRFVNRHSDTIAVNSLEWKIISEKQLKSYFFLHKAIWNIALVSYRKLLWSFYGCFESFLKLKIYWRSITVRLFYFWKITVIKWAFFLSSDTYASVILWSWETKLNCWIGSHIYFTRTLAVCMYKWTLFIPKIMALSNSRQISLLRIS